MMRIDDARGRIAGVRAFSNGGFVHRNTSIRCALALRFAASAAFGYDGWRLLLFKASLEWLKDGKVNGVSQGELKLGYELAPWR